MARDYAECALKVLVDVARDAKAPAAARVSAANAIIDRGYGKAPASMNFTTNPFGTVIREISERGSAMPIRSMQSSQSVPKTVSPDDDEDEDVDPLTPFIEC